MFRRKENTKHRTLGMYVWLCLLYVLYKPVDRSGGLIEAGFVRIRVCGTHSVLCGGRNNRNGMGQTIGFQLDAREVGRLAKHSIKTLYGVLWLGEFDATVNDRSRELIISSIRISLVDHTHVACLPTNTYLGST